MEYMSSVFIQYSKYIHMYLCKMPKGWMGWGGFTFIIGGVAIWDGVGVAFILWV